MDPNMKHVTNLVNSIIGVSVLAMPFCMKKCGLLLGLGLIMGAAWLTYVSCSMLVTAAQVKRRRTYEYLAFYTIGGAGKFAVELSMIGLMLGTCVAFYVVIGDLATGILSTFVQGNTLHLRTFVIVFCGLCIALPLGLMKNLSVLSSIGMVSLLFYLSFVCVMLFQAVTNGLLTFAWLHEVELFKPSGIFQCLPIFSLAYACQCQLFVVYDSMEEPSVVRMETIVSTAIKIVTTVYCLVAIFGYAVFKGEVQGNVLRNFPQNVLLDIIKFGFATSVVVGFPLMIFPCRQSIYTLFFRPQPVEGIASKTFIEPFTFKAITLSIVMSTMLLAISIPNVETILGLTGATMGSFICFIFPGIIFSKASKDNNSVSKFVFGIGCILLVVCTYSNLTSIPEPEPIVPAAAAAVQEEVIKQNDVLNEVNKIEDTLVREPEKEKIIDPTKPPIAEVVDKEHRHEPANPVMEEQVVNGDHANAELPIIRNDALDELVAANPVERNDNVEQNVVPVAVPDNNPAVEGRADVNNVARNVEPVVQQHAPVETVVKHSELPVLAIERLPIKNVEQKVEENKIVDHDQMDTVEPKAQNAVEESDTNIKAKILLEKIKEQNKKQNELLQEQGKLIKALEDDQKLENVKSDDSENNSVVKSNSLGDDLPNAEQKSQQEVPKPADVQQPVVAKQPIAKKTGDGIVPPAAKNVVQRKEAAVDPPVVKREETLNNAERVQRDVSELKPEEKRKESVEMDKEGKTNLDARDTHMDQLVVNKNSDAQNEEQTIPPVLPNEAVKLSVDDLDSNKEETGREENPEDDADGENKHKTRDLKYIKT
ncbi:putative sodium-coupled neutral amino acid transporter 10 [Ciona intestinalis]